ncbi:MAG: hypothetical protein JWO87_1720 [Phycisphaerales bacterium]|nr:hypothetical protein [Phycisphaerales bacterium]
MLTLVVVPVWWISTLLIRASLQLPNPPRAIFEITRDQVTMTLRDPSSKESDVFKWPRAAVVELRANQYEAGLWVNVPGHVKATYLSDLSRDTIELLEVELRAALASGKSETVGDAL